MPLQAWQSNPDLLSTPDDDHVARPRHLNVIYPTSGIYRSTSLGGNLNSPEILNFSTALNSPDDYELFYTPRATVRNKVPEKLKIPEIVLLNSSPDNSGSQTRSRSTKRFTVNHRMRNPRSARRFDSSSSSPFKHREVRDLLKSAKRRLKRITDEQDVQFFGGNNNRRESQGSMPGEARVQFALSQTPPIETIVTGTTPPSRHQHQNANTSANHTLSPVIQCFQNDK